MNHSDKPKSRNLIPPKNNPPKRLGKTLLIILGIAIATIAGVFFTKNQKPPENDQFSTKSDIRALGPDTAPVTITEYADFGCITCKAWHQFGIMQQVREKYSDQVRFIWRDFPVITSDSPKAAEAGFCAHDQGRFWEYHDVLYENAPKLSVADLEKYAAQIGLDAQEFNACLESGQHKETVDRELQDALGNGFRGTPSFVVNGEKLIGPPSFDQLSSIVDSILGNAN
jgi:protein-disulfide isomerase